MANISDVRAVNTPQKNYMWEFSVLGADANPGLTVRAKSVTIPQKSVEQIIINHKAGKSHHSGRDASGKTFTVTFWDDEALTVTKYFDSWLNDINDETTGTGSSKADYVRDIQIDLKDSADESVTGTIKMMKSFPTDMSDITLNYDGSDAVEVSVTFTFDKREIS